MLVTTIPGAASAAVEIAGSIIAVVGGLSILGGVITLILAIKLFVDAVDPGASGMPLSSVHVSAFGMAIGAILYGFLTIGLGAALKVFGRMGQLLEQNTLTLLRILERS